MVGGLSRKRSSVKEEKIGPSGFEVTVLQAKNVPQKPVLAIRAGNVLRHADVAVDTPFRVPVPDVREGCRLNVHLYQRLGTQHIKDTDEPESVCSVPVQLPGGIFSQVKLRIRRGREVASSSASSSDIEEYLQTHQLEGHVQKLIEIVLQTQPADPYRRMVEELQSIRKKTSAMVAKVPAPPSEPCPKTRPSALKSTSRLRLSESSQMSQPLPITQTAIEPELTNRQAARATVEHVIQHIAENASCTLSSSRENRVSDAGYGDTDSTNQRMINYQVRRMVFESCFRWETRLSGFYRACTSDFSDASFRGDSEAKALLTRWIRMTIFSRVSSECNNLS